jgi:ribosomal protein L3 glutamine methyltransferase
MMTPVDELITLRDWLRWTMSRFSEADLFFGHGTDNAWDEAIWLLLATLKLPQDRLEPFLDARLTRAERLAVWNALQQRIARRLPTALYRARSLAGDFSFLCG